MTDLRELCARKIVRDYATLKRATDGLRAVGHKVVVTIGSWDMLHIGHMRYLIAARQYGDILVVGADSDRAIGLYKGPHRPLIPEDERLEMLSYQDPITFVTLVDDVTKRGAWRYGLLRALRPDVFVAIEESYPERQRRAIARYVGQLEVIPRQAENTSSTGLFQKLIRTLPALATALDQRR